MSRRTPSFARRRAAQVLGALVVALAWLTPVTVHAGPVLFATTSGAPARSEATSIAVVREGERTAITISTTYQYEERFAILVPVPADTAAATLRVIDPGIFTRLATASAPIVRHLYEDNPCRTTPVDVTHRLGGGGTGSGIGYGAAIGRGLERASTAAAAGYALTLLDAAESASLGAWLSAEGYRAPEGMDAALAPYLAQSMRVLVVEVDPSRIFFEGGAAALAPFRYAYESAELSIPTRVGALDPGGAEDVVVYVFADAPHAPESASVLAPRHVDLSPAALERFDDVYAAIRARALDRGHATSLTELSCVAADCAGRGSVLYDEELVLLGAAVVTPDAPGDRPPVVRVRMGATDARGALSRAVMSGVIRRHLYEVQQCYEAALFRRAELEGELTLSLIAVTTGAVQTTNIGPTTIRDGVLDQCITRAARGWTFPPTAEGVTGVNQVLRLENTGGNAGLATRAFLSRARATRLYVGRRSPEEADLVLREADDAVDIEGDHPFGGSAEAFRVLPTRWDASFAVRHPWTGPIACAEPQRERWSETPPDDSIPLPSALALRRSEGAAIDLDAMIAADPHFRLSDPPPVAEPPPPAETPAEPPPPAAAPPAPASGFCAVAQADGSACSPTLVMALAGLAALSRRVRRRALSVARAAAVRATPKPELR